MAMRPPRPPYPWLNPGLDGQRELNLLRGPRLRQTNVYSALVQLRAEVLGELWDANAWVDLARGHILAGELEEGLQALEQADLLDALDPALNFQMGVLYLEVGEIARAIISLHRALGDLPHHAGVRLALARAWEHDPDVLGIQASRFYTEATRVDPGSVEAWLARADHEFEAEYWAGAFHSYRRALALEPDSVRALRGMALAADRAKQPAWACRVLLALGRVDREEARRLRSEIADSVRALGRGAVLREPA